MHMLQSSSSKRAVTDRFCFFAYYLELIEQNQIQCPCTHVLFSSNGSCKQTFSGTSKGRDFLVCRRNRPRGHLIELPILVTELH